MGGGFGRTFAQHIFGGWHSGAARVGLPERATPLARPQLPKLAATGLDITHNGLVGLKLTCPTDPGADIVVRASAALSRGRSSSRGKVRVMGLGPAPVQGAAESTVLYTAVPNMPPAGTKVFVLVNQLVDGWEDQPIEFSATVPEAV